MGRSTPSRSMPSAFWTQNGTSHGLLVPADALHPGASDAPGVRMRQTQARLRDIRPRDAAGEMLQLRRIWGGHCAAGTQRRPAHLRTRVWKRLTSTRGTVTLKQSQHGGTPLKAAGFRRPRPKIRCSPAAAMCYAKNAGNLIILDAGPCGTVTSMRHKLRACRAGGRGRLIFERGGVAFG